MHDFAQGLNKLYRVGTAFIPRVELKVNVAITEIA